MEQKIDLKQIEGVLDELAKVKGSLITILQKTQDIYGYLPKDAIIYISERTGIAESEIMGVATFYTQFRLAPVGKYLICFARVLPAMLIQVNLFCRQLRMNLELRTAKLPRTVCSRLSALPASAVALFHRL